MTQPILACRPAAAGTEDGVTARSGLALGCRSRRFIGRDLPDPASRHAEGVGDLQRREALCAGLSYGSAAEPGCLGREVSGGFHEAFQLAGPLDRVCDAGGLCEGLGVHMCPIIARPVSVLAAGGLLTRLARGNVTSDANPASGYAKGGPGAEDTGAAATDLKRAGAMTVVSLACPPAVPRMKDGVTARPACTADDVDPDWWFPEPGDQVTAARAKQICSTCPAAAWDACITTALETQAEHGVWGGIDFGENARTPAPRCEQCWGPAPSRRHRYCPPCKAKVTRDRHRRDDRIKAGYGRGTS